MKKKKTQLIILGIVFVLLLALLFIVKRNDDDIKVNQNETELLFDTSAIKTEEKEIEVQELEYVEYPGFASSYSFNEEVRSLALNNPKDNSSYFVYTIKIGEDILYQSEAIAPDYEVIFDVYAALDAGMHELHINIASYDLETKTKDFYSPSYKVNAYVEKEI